MCNALMLDIYVSDFICLVAMDIVGCHGNYRMIITVVMVASGR